MLAVQNIKFDINNYPFGGTPWRLRKLAKNRSMSALKMIGSFRTASVEMADIISGMLLIEIS